MAAPRSFRRLSLLLVAALCWSALSLAAQELSSPDSRKLEGSAASRAWLLGQITPNPTVPDPDPARRRLLLSYAVSPESSPRGYHRSHIYDDALAVLAFEVTGDTDAAAFTLHALARQLRPDGSLWSGYNTANRWPTDDTHEGALVRAGAVAWVGYAFTFHLQHAPPCAPGDAGCARERALFRETALRLGRYLRSLQVESPGDPRLGLVRLGYGSLELAYQPETDEVIEVYSDEPALGVSTENNISAWFFLRGLAELTGEDEWRQAADRIRQGLLANAWNPQLGQFNQGFLPEGAPDPTKALDCASWGALFLLAAGEPQGATAALAAADRYYATEDGKASGYRPYADSFVYRSPEVGRFYFPDHPRRRWRDLPLVWSEGTLGVALAYLRLGRPERARELLAGLLSLQAEGGAFRYASLDVPHQMSDRPSVAASAWWVLVTEALAGNPLAEQVWQ